jgi:hypothetical protein
MRKVNHGISRDYALKDVCDSALMPELRILKSSIAMVVSLNG